MPLIINPQSYFSYEDELNTKLKNQAEIIEIASNSILITAMHGVPQLREDRIKDADEGSLEFAF